MTNPTDPPGLLMDLRERMVRIETKLDTNATESREHAKTAKVVDTRLTAIETGHAKLQAAIATLRWVGGTMLAALTLFGTNLQHIFR